MKRAGFPKETRRFMAVTRWILSCVAVVAWAGVAHAHHSIAGVYDRTRDVTVDGVVTQFQFVNPHPVMIVDVRRGGATERWQLEMDNRGELAGVGFTEITFKPGDRVVVTGSPARREPYRLYIQRLQRPADGFAYEQVGNRPQVRTPAR